MSALLNKILFPAKENQGQANQLRLNLFDGLFVVVAVTLLCGFVVVVVVVVVVDIGLLLLFLLLIIINFNWSVFNVLIKTILYFWR